MRRFSRSRRASALSCAATAASSIGATSAKSVPQSIDFSDSKAVSNISKVLVEKTIVRGKRRTGNGRLQLPRLATRAIDHPVRFGIVDELLFGGNPFHR